jgi:CHAT domain-containing protein
LHNLDTEEKYFGELHNKTGARGRTLVNVLAELEAGRSFAETLEQALKERHYDFVHFAGHSYTTLDGRTFLILPDKRPDRVVGLPIESFARWAGKAGVRFTYLSSCRGGSWEGVRTMVDNGVPQVLGFRWDVEDDKAAHFAQVFYDGLLKNSGSFASAYRDACEKLHDESSSTNPIWATPVMVIQNDDWWCRTAGERDVALSRAA